MIKELGSLLTASGPLQMKLAQFIASSEGIFPEELCIPCRKYLDQADPIPQVKVSKILATLDPKLSVDPKPIKAASIAQVHRGTYKGSPVVVKIQRPDLKIRGPLFLLRTAAKVLNGKIAGIPNLPGMIEDFAANLREELDFRKEAENMREFNAVMHTRGIPTAIAPHPVMSLSTKTVLVMEALEGVAIDSLEPSAAAEQLLVNGINAWWATFDHGHFHGDVHAGNIMALTGGRVGFVDFGIVGSLLYSRRPLAYRFVRAIANGDPESLARVLQEVCRQQTDTPRLIEALGRRLSRKQLMKYDELLPLVMRSVADSGLVLPQDFILLVKQMIYFSRYGRKLAPELDVFRDERIAINQMI